jgi:L-arabinose transport system ATP-binding protein
MAGEEYFLQFSGIGKSFPGVRALDGIDFGVREGSVHALIGENGAGKSTLLKILGGIHPPTEGYLSIGGTPRRFNGAGEAIRSGIAVIHQELQLVPELSVAENLFLGRLPSAIGMVQRKKLHAAALEQLEFIGEPIDPRVRVGRLSIAQRQMVEIAKALARGAKVLAFDEPTSSLSEREVQRLFEIIDDLKASGHVILYVSHRLEEIFRLCDAVTVFRDGRLVKSFQSMEGLDRRSLISLMVGRDLTDVFGYRTRTLGGTALEVSELIGQGLSAPASFSVAQGEILGIFGLVGAGRTELLRLIFGAEAATSGTIRVHDTVTPIQKPIDAIRNGLSLCPEDRKQEGIIAVRSVKENLNLSSRPVHAFGGFFLNPIWEQSNASHQIAALGIKTPSPGQLIRNLSGGNQQKTIFARWLSGSLKVMLLDEPTRGIDVGSKREIYHLIYDLAERGLGVVMVSSELPEVLGVCDRILVMNQGRITGELARGEATEQKILDLALPQDE